MNLTVYSVLGANLLRGLIVTRRVARSYVTVAGTLRPSAPRTIAVLRETPSTGSVNLALMPARRRTFLAFDVGQIGTTSGRVWSPGVTGRDRSD